jgi:hypothetical protein
VKTFDSELSLQIERIRADIVAEYAQKHHIAPRAFVLSCNTPPVRIDPDLSLQVDRSKAEFVRTIRQTVQRLNAQAVFSVSESWLTKLTTTAAGSARQSTVVEVVLATLSQRDASETVWIAAIERVEGAKPLLKEWFESHPQHMNGIFSHFSSGTN